ncbi:MAG: hypothetical protein ACQEQ4_10520 [Fibrobacterota bacterium]
MSKSGILLWISTAVLLSACAPSAALTMADGETLDADRLMTEKRIFPVTAFTPKLHVLTDVGTMSLSLRDIDRIEFTDGEYVNRKGRTWQKASLSRSTDDGVQSIPVYIAIDEMFFARGEFGGHAVRLHTLQSIDLNPEDTELVVDNEEETPED